MRVLAARTAAADVSTPVVVGRGGRPSPTTASDALAFEPADVLERVEEHGDLYADNLTDEQDLPELG